MLYMENIRDDESRIATQVSSKIIYEISLDALEEQRTPFDISTTATPERYRLVDCRQFAHERVLSIYEFAEFPQHISYTTVSYIWRGNPVPPNFSDLSFSVSGAEEADPIGIRVLSDACLAALMRGATHLWLDRLCLMQKSKTDKTWQIHAMGRWYHSCLLCIVVPGGLQRLVSFDEETGWIHRGWTLQEAVAPPLTVVLFHWTLGSGAAHSKHTGEDSFGDLEEVSPGQSAIVELGYVLAACLAGYFSFVPAQHAAQKKVLVLAQMFGTQPFDLDHLPDNTSDSQPVILPHVVALGLAAERNIDMDYIKDYCIWQSALLRTSSRPVDMVFSIMGLFNVTLDTTAFHKDDRIGATIALARAILQQGRRASWMGLLLNVPPCPQLSTFPTFPKTAVEGKALVEIGGRTRDVIEFMESVYPNDAALGPLPQGTMDESGYHTFTAKAIRIVPFHADNQVQPNLTAHSSDMPYSTQITAVDGSIWDTFSNEEPTEEHEHSEKRESRTFAVLLGFYNGFPARTNENNIRLMVIEKHAPAKFHVRTYVVLGTATHQTFEWIRAWTEETFCVGGPDLPVTPHIQGDTVQTMPGLHQNTLFHRLLHGLRSIWNTVIGLVTQYYIQLTQSVDD